MNLKSTIMDQILLLSKIYKEAFKNLGHKIIKHGFKIYFWASAVLFLIVLYAFIYRLSTGFAWD